MCVLVCVCVGCIVKVQEPSRLCVFVCCFTCARPAASLGDLFALTGELQARELAVGAQLSLVQPQQTAVAAALSQQGAD